MNFIHIINRRSVPEEDTYINPDSIICITDYGNRYTYRYLITLSGNKDIGLDEADFRKLKRAINFNVTV